MKGCPFYIILLCVFSFSSFSQKLEMNETKWKTEGKTTTTVKKLKTEAASTKAASSYHVVEKINMNFGGYTTTYEVSQLSQVNTYDLGPNNTRVVVPNFGKEEDLTDKQIKKQTDSIKQSVAPVELSVTETSNKNTGYISINPLRTYERLADKGYKTIDWFQKLGNAYFFIEKLRDAAKWYSELFSMTTDLETVYYYRYARSLIYIGDITKGEEMMQKYNELSQKEKDKNKNN
jgi:hypothetical protein